MKRPRVSARVRANRINAQRSTGPKTAKGKARSAQNATLFHFRSASGVAQDDARVALLVRMIAGDDADAETKARAQLVAEAHLKALLVRRVSAIAWGILRDNHPMQRSLPEFIGDPIAAEVMDPDERAWIRGDAPPDAVELRLVARLVKYAARVRSKCVNGLMRHIRVLSRYEGRSLARFRAACANYRRFVAEREAATQPTVAEGAAPVERFDFAR